MSALRFLLDTNICIYIINRKPPDVFKRFAQHGFGEIGVSSITAAELAFGVSKSGSERNRRALGMFLAPLEVLAFDAEAALRYGDVRAALESNGTPIGALDQLIAAHALVLGATLVTNNLRELRRVPGLQLENWVASKS